MKLGSFLDNLIAPFAPIYAAKRLHARKTVELLNAFDASKKTRTVKDWPDESFSPDQAIIPEFDTIGNRSRAQVRTDWAGASARRAYRRHTWGIGITPRARACNHRTGELLETFNQRRQTLWDRYANDASSVDVEGRKTINELVGLMHDEWRIMGNGFLIWSYVPNPDEVGLRFQGFEVEQLAADGSRGLEPHKGNQIRKGVEVDPFGRPVAYWVHTDRHPLESAIFPGTFAGSGSSLYTKPVRIPAQRVIRLSRQTRFRETIQVGELAPVLMKMFQQQGYDSSEQLAKKLESFLAFSIYRDPQAGGNIGFDGTADPQQVGNYNAAGSAGGSATEYRKMQFQPGMVPVMNFGEKIEMHDPRRPGQAYVGYTEMQLSMIAAGLGLNLSNLLRVFKGSYSSERMGMLELWKEIDPDQQLITTDVLKQIWSLHGYFAILERKLAAPGYFSSPDIRHAYNKADFQAPPRPYMDPAKEAAAAKIDRDYFIASLEDQLNKRNIDVREQVKVIANVRKMCNDLGFDLPELRDTGPKASKSEPKPHGTGDTPGSDSKTKPRTQAQADTDDLVNMIIQSAINEPEDTPSGWDHSNDVIPAPVA